MKRSTAKLLQKLNVVLLLVLVSIIAPSGNMTTLYIVAIASLISSFFLNQFLRCPHCGYLPRRGTYRAHYCPNCGEPLDD